MRRRRHVGASWATFAMTSAVAILLIVPAGATANRVVAGGISTEPTAAVNLGETATPIKHVISLMQENHSFDNYFGTYPGADGIPVGTCVPWDPKDPEGGCLEPFPIAGRPIVDLGHSSSVWDAQYNDGAMDGFLKVFEGQRDGADLALGYYDDADLPYYWNVADNYVLFDRFFSSAIGGSVPNHFFWVTGDPGGTDLRPEGFDEIATIFDRLEEAGISWKFYVQGYDPEVTFRNPAPGDKGSQLVWVPLLNYARYVDDPELNQKIVPFEEFFTDLEAGTLPAVAYMVPSGSSEHPPGSIQAGERFVRGIITALMRSDAWETTAFTWTYDDWGGWYDHVTPPQVDDWGYGFRVPALLVSAYAKRGYVDSTEMDFTSILKFIELNWGLEPLTERDASVATFMDAFDFDSPPREPVFLNLERNIPPPEPPKSQVVYVSYSLALVIPLGLALLGVLTNRRATRRRAIE